MNLCAICDSDKRFTYFLCEWSNSQHDQRIFAAEDIYRHSTIYFIDDQFLLSDSVYINTSYLITSYKTSHTRNIEIRRFNRRLSRIRIDIEHVFEILKDRWKSLIDLRLRVRDKKSYIYVIRWIIACVILHNILLNIQNEWDEEEEWWTTEEEIHDEELKQLSNKQLIERLIKRDQMKELVLNEN
jgi:hypothetical protein